MKETMDKSLSSRQFEQPMPYPSPVEEMKSFLNEINGMNQQSYMSPTAYDDFLQELGPETNGCCSIKAKFVYMCLSLQKNLCESLLQLEENNNFRVDTWKRQEGGGGITCVLENGKVFDRAGVNISVVKGLMPPAGLASMKSRRQDIDDNAKLFFFAAGISSVIHPTNPMVPTMHFNMRFFEAITESGKVISWFGGGSDLTPYYLFKDDVVHFHTTLKRGCDQHNQTFYPTFKQWCDDYFHIQCRGERRGVGGIFFDDLEDPSIEECFKFMLSYSNVIIESYIPIVKRRCTLDYTAEHIAWQHLRRGRYVEFNLIYDRGTTFGLKIPGSRIESILMSLPPIANWQYMHEPLDGSKEAELMEILKHPIDWL